RARAKRTAQRTALGHPGDRRNASARVDPGLLRHPDRRARAGCGGYLHRYIDSIYRVCMLELAVLGLLAEQPRHGYDLKKRLSETLGPLWGISFGSLYPALRRLERNGAIEATEADGAPAAIIPTGSLKGDLAAARVRRRPRAGLRTRKAYRITPAGEQL